MHKDIINYLYNKLPAQLKSKCHVEEFADFTDLKSEYKWIISCDANSISTRGYALILPLCQSDCLDIIYDELLRLLCITK